MDPSLKEVFRKIGVPEPEPFKPDPFQVEALQLIGHYDVLVSAPTGAGKTWIATQAIHSYLSQGRRVWYASPLKALSNSIYQMFCHEFGPHDCGILTGDRKENAEAPVIVGTTEILRNQLYDAMHQGQSVRADLVILDEAHYLSDPERGVVWEEVLIYLPSRVRLLLLSATIPNAEMVCSWLHEIRGSPNRVVRAHERPVPLEMLFLFPDGQLVPLGGKRGLHPRIRKFHASKAEKWKRASVKVDFGDIIEALRGFDLLPAIFFLKSRADCDRALLTCPTVEKPPRWKAKFSEELHTFLNDYPHLQRHRQIKCLEESLVGSHHGGQLPYWKVLIEKMMNRGCLEAIFSTSTVAAGVNFPARTVVLVQSDRYNGREFIDLTATDLHQMIGRAGRRGKDHIGFALVVPGLHQDPQLLHELQDSPPEPIRSQIYINFSMTLNLLLSHTPEETRELLDRSFATFQDRQSSVSLRLQWKKMLSYLNGFLPMGKCDRTDPYEILENIQKRSELLRRAKSLARAVQYEEQVRTYKGYLKPGTLFLHKNRSIYVVFHTYFSNGRFLCAAHNIRRNVRARKGRISLKRVDLGQIQAVLDYRVDLPEDTPSERLEGIFAAIPVETLAPLKVEVSEGLPLDNLEKRMEDSSAIPCEGCKHVKLCHGRKGADLRQLLNEFRLLSTRTESVGSGLWLNFKRHLRFLKETGFVDAFDRLTPDGYWASKLRLDQPLLIAEAIRKRAFDGVSPELLAGGLAPFVWDKMREMEIHIRRGVELTDMEKLYDEVVDRIQHIRSLKNKRGFQSPLLLFWPGAALYLWARGCSWEELLTVLTVDEGDMASLITRTADHLRQITSLMETHPGLASIAEKAIGLILREPVYVE